MNTTAKNILKLKKLAIAAMFSALAYAATFVVHIGVQFLTLDFKDALLLIGAMICGPVYALIMPIIVALIEFITISDTGVYGLIMNFISSAAFCIPATIVYSRKRNFTFAIVGICTAVVSTTSVMMLANLIVTPYFMHTDVATVVGLIPVLLLPFNLAKSIMNAGIVAALYKPVSTALKRARITEFQSLENSRENKVFSKKSIVMLVLSVLLIAAGLVILFIFLNGKISFGKTIG